MVALDSWVVEDELIKLIDEINKNILGIEIDIDKKCCPAEIGISSQILITIMSRVGNTLDVKIPNDCYIFHDKKSGKQLSIEEAAQKLIEKVQNGK